MNYNFNILELVSTKYKNTMRTLMKTFVRNNKTITIVGVIHIGTSNYYNEIQSELDNNIHDIVLYEGITGYSPDNKIRKVYKDLSKTLGFTSQIDSITYNKDWVNVDLDKALLDSVKGKSFIDSIPDIESDDIKNLSDINRTLLMIIFKIALLYSRFKKPDPVILEIRNYKIILETFNHLAKNNNVCLFYGDAHTKGIEKYIKSVGFKLISTKYINPLK